MTSGIGRLAGASCGLAPVAFDFNGWEMLALEDSVTDIDDSKNF